jgi:large subunit ribosomal protein L9
MSKVDVILVRSVSDLGAEGDQVKVAAGYARNYLVPQGYAIPVTMANKRHLDALKERRIAREAREVESMTELGAMLSKLVLDVAVKTNDDHSKMYGSVTSTQSWTSSNRDMKLRWTSTKLRLRSRSAVWVPMK